MTYTLGDLRKRAYNLLDDQHGDNDTAGTRWSLEEVDDALEVALDEVVLMLVQLGSSELDEVAELSISSGAVDLSSYQPLIIKSVEYKSGSTYVPVVAVRNSEANVAQSISGTVRVRFVARPALPESESSNLDLGAGTSVPWPTLVQLVAVKAAQHLLPKDGEINPALDAQESRLWSTIQAVHSVPRVYKMSEVSVGAYSLVNPYASHYVYSYKPYTLSLHLSSG